MSNKKGWDSLRKEDIGETCLVTGGSGFVGSKVVEKLLQIGCKVRIFDMIPSSQSAQVEFIKGDITNYEQVHQVMEGVDTVFHLAAIISLFGKEKLMEKVNVEGTMNVIKACKSQKVRKLVYTSSVAVYFKGENLLDAKEDETPSLEELPHIFQYGRCKWKAEKAVLEANSEDLLTCAIRPEGIYGPRDTMILGPLVKLTLVCFYENLLPKINFCPNFFFFNREDLSK